MDTFITHLSNIVSVDWATIIVVSALCAAACYFVKELLAQPPMIVFVFPVMLFFGLTAYYLFVVLEQFTVKKLDQWLMWTILASICGVVIGIGCLTALAALREKLAARQRPLPRPSRATR